MSTDDQRTVIISRDDSKTFAEALRGHEVNLNSSAPAPVPHTRSLYLKMAVQQILAAHNIEGITPAQATQLAGDRIQAEALRRMKIFMDRQQRLDAQQSKRKGKRP
jgi:hypothetical protein